MAADILGQRVDRHVGAVAQRMLEDRAEQRVVAHDRSAGGPGCARSRRRCGATSAMSTSVLSRVGRRLDQDDGDAALLPARGSSRPASPASSTPSAKPTAPMPKAASVRDEQRLGAAVERLRMQDDVAGPREGEDGRGDRRHAGGEQDARLGALVDREPVLDDLAVGVVEARVDEARAGALSAARLRPEL